MNNVLIFFHMRASIATHTYIYEIIEQTKVTTFATIVEPSHHGSSFLACSCWQHHTRRSLASLASARPGGHGWP